MKGLWLFGLLAGVAAWAAVPSQPGVVVAGPVAGGVAPEVAGLIQKMGDDSFRVREEATRALWSMGEAVVPALKEAMKSRDPEVAARARELADQIDLGILPDTPEEVRALVAKYRGTEGRQKLPVVFELQRMKAWRPILKLFALEKDGELREALREAIDGVAVRAAREELAAGRVEGARMFLDLAPKDAEGWMALAALHAASGSAAEELKKAREVEAENGAQWRLALCRATGDLAAAVREARAAGETDVAAALELLAGDPRPWLERPGATAGKTFFHEQYAKFAARQWKTGLADGAAVKAITRAMEDADDEERWFGISALFLAGSPAEGERALEKMNRVVAFGHYDTMERADDALRLMGVDPVKPDFVAWAKGRVAKVLADPDDSEEESEELLLMGAFLERRGLEAEAREWLAPFLDELMEENPEVFTDKLAEMYAYGMEILATEAAGRYADDDPVRWSEVFAAAFKEDTEVAQWWSLLATLDPEAAPVRRFEAMLAVFGKLTTVDELRQATLKRVWKLADDAGQVEKERLLGLLAYAGIESGDLQTTLRALRPLVAGKPEHARYGYYLLLLSAAGEWKEAVEAWRKLVEQSPDRPDLHAYLASSLRRAGEAEAAAKQDELVKLLALGEGKTMVRIGQGYAYGGDFARAADWWRRVLIEGTPGDGPWDAALQLCSDSALEAGDWKTAAALGEALALSQMDGGSAYEAPVRKLRVRMHADMARALSRIDKERKASAEVLAGCHALMPVDGSLADYFLPALRRVGMRAEHDRWFEATWKDLEALIRKYPRCDNTRNTAAWVAARAVRRLDEAEAHLKVALAARPRQAAYLDTMGEIWFARRDRERALEWSAKAMANEAADDMLRRQYERFRAGAFPEK